MESYQLSNGHVYLLIDISVQGGDLWTANKHPELSPTDLFYASFFMGVGGVLSLLFTLYPVVIILYDKQMQQVFCYFLISSCIANTSVVLIMLFYCIPAVVYKIFNRSLNDHLFSENLESVMGGLFIYVYYVSFLSHFLMSFNRFYAIVWHLHLGDCKYIYHEEFTIFSYGLSHCSLLLEKWDMTFTTTIVIVTSGFDLVVAIGLMKRAFTILTGLVYLISTGLYHFSGHTFKSEDMWKVFFFDQFPKLCAILLIGIFCVTLQKRIREKFKEHFLIFCCLVLKEKEVEAFEFVLSFLESSVVLPVVDPNSIDPILSRASDPSEASSGKEKRN